MGIRAMSKVMQMYKNKHEMMMISLKLLESIINFDKDEPSKNERKKSMELSEELRLGLTYFAGEAVDCSDLMEEAADRIEAQAVEIEQLMRLITNHERETVKLLSAVDCETWAAVRYELENDDGWR
jgi:hypothetical protein